MRAVEITGPREARLCEVDAPVAGAGQVVVDVHRVGLCGTDVEFFTGEMAYLHDGNAAYPLRIGHEWCGTVATVGPEVDERWLGRRVTGDTMLGCGTCRRCRSGRQHVCADRHEIGIRSGWPGALAEQLVVPASALYALPDTVDDRAGAMVEPGGNALRTVEAAALQPGERLLIVGPGTIGLLAASFARAQDLEVHLLGDDPASLAYARELGFANAWSADELPELPYDGVIDATFGVDVPRLALELVEPARRVVYIGLSGEPSLIDTRDLVLQDITAVGILSASPGLRATIEHYGSGVVDPTLLVAATVGLGEAAEVMGGWRPPDAGRGPKIHIDPRR